MSKSCLFRPKRTTELALDENADNSRERDTSPSTKPDQDELCLERLGQLKLYDSTPLDTISHLRRTSSTMSRWAPKKTQDLGLNHTDISLEVAIDNKKAAIDPVPEESVSTKSIESKNPPEEGEEEEENTPDCFPPPPRFMHRSSMNRLKLRGRQVLGLLNNKEFDQELPSIFRNVKSPEMRATADVTKSPESSESSRVDCSINLDTQQAAPSGKDSSPSLAQLKEVLSSDEKDFTPFVLDVLEQGYLIKSILGKGGTGTVFVGEANGEEFAVKVTEIQGDEERISGFYREASLMRRLKDNKHVIQIIEEALVGDCAFIVMEKGVVDLYCHLLTFTAEIPLYTLAKWFYDMICAVVSLHQVGILHADLKPANFLVMADGRLKLTDFGISKLKQRLSESILAEREVVMAGTLNFLCPEAVNSIMQHKPSIMNETADIWSLGVIFYYLLYKELPFGRISDKREKMLAIVDANRALKFPKICRYYPEMFREMCQACLQYDFRSRPKAAELLEKYPIDMIILIER